MRNTALLDYTHNSLPSLFLSVLCCAAILLTAIPASADEPPARIGRVSLTDGEVSFYSDKSEGWRRARLNFPVTSKNSIWTNGVARAEVRVGASAVRIDADSILDFARVDDARTQLFLQRGTLNVRLRSYPGGSGDETYRDTFRVETNEGVVILQSNGRYRFDAAQDRNETRVSVFAGRARFDNGNAALNVDVGKTLVVRQMGGTPSFQYELAMEAPFDRWAEARDTTWDSVHQRYANLPESRRISSHMTGYEDLDAHGDWVDDRDYGRLWSPRVVISGWAPYRHGNWSYVRPWGWTWVDHAAWGFAPFHYGRWVHRHARWYWWPGAYRHRPVYAPALVGWVGRGNWGVSLSVGDGGGVGWFPLAPREHYVPAYTTNHTYIRNINHITHNHITVVQPPTTFANQVPGSTHVNSNIVVHGEPVWTNTTSPRHASTSPGATWTAASLTPPPSPAAANVNTKPLAMNTPQQLNSPQPQFQPQVVTGENLRTQSAAPAMIVPGEPVRTVATPRSMSKPAEAASAAITAPAQPALPMGQMIKPNPVINTAPSSSASTTKTPTPQFDAPVSVQKKPGVLMGESMNDATRERLQQDRRDDRLQARAQQREYARTQGRNVDPAIQKPAVATNVAPAIPVAPPAPVTQNIGAMVKPKPAVDTRERSEKHDRVNRNERAQQNERGESHGGGKIGRAAERGDTSNEKTPRQ